MEVKTTTTFIVGLVVAILLTAGVVVPVIADVSDNDGGNGGSSNATYTNTGDIYMKTPSAMTETEEHAIGFTVQNNKVQLRYDGELFTEKNVNGTDSFNIPIIIQPNDSEYDGYQIMIFERSVFDGTPVLSFHTYILDKVSSPNGWYIGSGSGTVPLSQNGYTMEIQTYSAGYSVILDGTLEDQNIPYTLAFSYNEGDWVVADNPVVNPSKDFYIFDASPITSENGIYQQTYAYGRGNTSFFTEFYIEECGYAYDSQNDMDLYAYTNESAYLNIPVTTVDAGVRLGNLGLTAEFVASNNVLFTTDATFNTYIVPKTVTAGEQSHAGWLSDDFGALPSSSAGQFYVVKDDDTHVSVYADYLNPNQYTEVPFYEHHDLSVSPLIIAFGSDWCAYVDLTSLIGVTDGSDAYIYVNDWNTLASRIGVAPDGTSAYLGASFGSEFTELPSKAMGYISPNGTMKTYYNENAPKSDSMYTWIADIGYNDTEMWQLVSCAYNGFSNPTVFGNGAVRSGSVQPVDPFLHSQVTKARGGTVEYTLDSLEFTTSGNNVTGANAVYKAGSATFERSYSLTDQTPATLDGGALPTGTMMICIVPTGTEYSDGNGGAGVSGTLKAMLSVVPIVILAGIALMTVGYMRSRA